MKSQAGLIGGLATALTLLAVGAVSLSAQQGATATRGAAEEHAAEQQPTVQKTNVEILNTTVEHWSDEYLRSLEAERTPEQSIYLAAVQQVEIERRLGDVGKAIPFLESLAGKSKTAQLRSAVRRLLVEIHLERGDTKRAEAELNRIIAENLAQL